jgi:hypothetical protein
MAQDNGVFTPQERRAALLALAGAALLVAFGGLAQQWIRPSTGAIQVHKTPPPPGVLQARPLPG